MSSQPAALGRGDILVVDDTAANLRLLTRLLQDAGYQVRAVTTGARALAAVRQNLPALVLLDVRLPDLNGVEVCAQLKAAPETSQVPVIFISALTEAETKLNAFKVGGVDYVTKPIQPDEVLARVATHLALRELHMQLSAANAHLARQIEALEQANEQLVSQIHARQIAEQANTRLLEHERQRALRLELLRTSINTITSALDLAAVHQAVVTQAVALLGTCWGALARSLPPGEELQVVALHDLPVGLQNLRISWGQGLIGKAAAGRRIVNSQTTPEPLIQAGVALAAPLIAGEQLEGVLMVINPAASKPFGGEEIQLLDLFAQQAAIAIQNARLFEEVRHLARIDPLTGLYNRRHFFELAERELERARRNSSALAILLLDVDHFKQINDGYGHHGGDLALRAVADLLRISLRATDVSARLGGEELVVLLPDARSVRAVAVAERLRRKLAALEVPSERGVIQLTGSFGVATLEGGALGKSLETLLARADEACYDAKRAGRDRVSLWAEPETARTK